MKKEEKIIIEETKKLLKLLGIEGKPSISLNKDDSAELVLETEDSGIIIGHHGDMLEALQIVLSLCVSKKLGKFVRISLEVGDYKKNRTDYQFIN